LKWTHGVQPDSLASFEIFSSEHLLSLSHNRKRRESTQIGESEKNKRLKKKVRDWNSKVNIEYCFKLLFEKLQYLLKTVFKGKSENTRSS